MVAEVKRPRLERTGVVGTEDGPSGLSYLLCSSTGIGLVASGEYGGGGAEERTVAQCRDQRLQNCGKAGSSRLARKGRVGLADAAVEDKQPKSNLLVDVPSQHMSQGPKQNILISDYSTRLQPKIKT